MELVTHGGEHHEIGDGGWLMMTTATNPPLRSPERTPDQPSREVLGLGGVPYRKTRWFLLSDFFLFESKYIELELASEGFQGAHEVGGRSLGGQARPHPRGQGVGPLALILSPIFFIISKNNLREVSGHSENFCFCTKITPWQFCWKQRQSGLVPFKSYKIESKTRAKVFGKVDTTETYQLPQA